MLMYVGLIIGNIISFVFSKPLLNKISPNVFFQFFIPILVFLSSIVLVLIVLAVFNFLVYLMTVFIEQTDRLLFSFSKFADNWTFLRSRGAIRRRLIR